MDTADGACMAKLVTSGNSSVRDMEADEEPCTQPLAEEEQEVSDSQESIMDIDSSQQPFGYLVPLKPNGPAIPLEKDSFAVGRGAAADYRIEDKNMKNFEAISKVHFLLVRKATGIVVLLDKSSNGSFVNGKKVPAKTKQTVLNHNDVIALAVGKEKHFLYMNNMVDHQKMYPKELRAKYTVAKELGKGACGTVMLGIRKEDHAHVAIKMINKKKVTMVQPGSVHNVMNEVKLLKQIDHPCIIRLEDVVETNDELFIILELANGGELFDKIIEKSKLAEAEAKLHFYQIVSAIDYLHSKNIAHRDLKPENILLCSDDDLNPVVKVTDLGLSKFVDVTTYLKTFCGTPQYLAPEVLFSRVRGDGSYDLKVDMWSLGVILYILLCGCPPFNPDRKDKPLIRQVTEGDFSFPPKMWSKISDPAVDLVKRLMTVSPKERLSASDALKHPWLVDEVITSKARKLMATQTRHKSTLIQMVSGVSCLNGILPEEWSAVDKGSSSCVRETFKRPLLEETLTAPAGSSCKRVKLNQD